MASPLLLAAVVLLASEATAGPTILEWLSGIQYVPPAGWVDTSDPPCQDCTGRALFGLLAPATPPCCSGCLKCGVERSRRIVSGTETSPGKYPWIAVYKVDGGPTAPPLLPRATAVGGCAATLVSSDWAVTSAHCVAAGVLTQAGLTATSLTLILGEHTISTTDDEFDGNRKEVALAMDPIIHPLFDVNNGPDYDIALLKLAESVDLGVYTPVCLPAATDDFTGGTASVYGWGLTDFCDLTSFATTLKETEVTIITNEACAAISTEISDCSTPPITATVTISGPTGALPGGLTDRMLCGLAPGKGACFGDDGSPLTVESGGQHTLAGTVSSGTCGLGDSTGLPGLYANVANLRTWLDTAINANGGLGNRCLL